MNTSNSKSLYSEFDLSLFGVFLCFLGLLVAFFGIMGLWTTLNRTIEYLGIILFGISIQILGLGLSIKGKKVNIGK